MMLCRAASLSLAALLGLASHVMPINATNATGLNATSAATTMAQPVTTTAGLNTTAPTVNATTAGFATTAPFDATTAGFDTTAPFTTAADTNATMKADYTHPDNATTAPSDITTAGFDTTTAGFDTTAPPPANATIAPSNITTAGFDTTAPPPANATIAPSDITTAGFDTTAPSGHNATTAADTVADADTTAAAAAPAGNATAAPATTQAPAAAGEAGEAGAAGTTEAPKEIAVKEDRQSAAFAVPMNKDDCDKMQKSPEDIKKTLAGVAAAAKVDATKLDLGASSSKCAAQRAARRQRRESVSLEVTLVFKKGVSAAEVATAVVAANALIAADGGLKVTVTIGGVSKTIAVTQTVTQATQVVTVMVPNPAYVAAVTTAADTTVADADTTAAAADTTVADADTTAAAAHTNATEPASTAAAGNTTTAQTGTTTNAVVNTPKASASLARGSALLVAALAASHALLA